MIPVIDISRWQGDVDFKVMASRGVKGVIIRCSNGKTIDPKIIYYMPAAQAAGLETGVYGFVNPKSTDATTAARVIAEAHKRWKCTIPPMLDVENYVPEPGTLPVIQGAPFAAYLRTMTLVVDTEARKPIIYTNRAYWNPWVGDASFGGFDIIVARYPWYSPEACAANVPPSDATKWGEWLFPRTSKRPQVPMGWDTWQAWQFSAGFNKQGATYGCSSSDLDLNIVRPDVWERWVGRHNPPPDIEKPPDIVLPVQPPTEETDDVDYITNADPCNDDIEGKPFDPLVIKWKIMDDGRILQVTELEGRGRNINRAEVGVAMSNHDIFNWPRWPVPAGGTPAGPMTVELTGWARPA